MFGSNPPVPNHVAGTSRGEERVKKSGREHGRSDRNRQGYREARDSTSINPEAHGPIDPRMPSIPPA